MSQIHTCDGCGCTVIQMDKQPPMENPPPDGLAYGRKRILQVNNVNKVTGEDEPPVLFEYYTTYGDDGVVVVRSEGVVIYLPVRAVLAFTDHFRKELQEVK